VFSLPPHEDALESYLAEPSVSGHTTRRALMSSFMAIQQPHFAAELEIAARLIQHGFHVEALSCRGQLTTCFSNAHHRFNRCLACRGNRRIGYCAVSQMTRAEVHFNEVTQTRGRALDDLRSLVRAKHPPAISSIKLAARSSTISYFKDASDQREGFIEMSERAEASGLQTFLSTRRILESKDFELAVVFNGRFAEEQGVVQAAESLNLRVFAHEAGERRTSYRVYRGRETHDLKRMKSEVNEIQALRSASIDSSDPEQLGHQFFRRQRSGGDEDYGQINPFIKSQLDGCLPPGFNPTARNVAIFSSSEDEYEAVSGWSKADQVDQTQVTYNLSALLSQAGYQVWLRIHPHLRDRPNNSQLNALRQAEVYGAMIISPDDPTSSYALAEASSAVITFGSTIGIEAAYWGWNSILMGRAIYEDLDACRRPQDLSEVIEAIEAGPLPHASERALSYGSSTVRAGTPHRWSTFSPSRPIQFDGVPLVPPTRRRIVRRVAEIIGR
jgi:hypothetical protein